MGKNSLHKFVTVLFIAVVILWGFAPYAMAEDEATDEVANPWKGNINVVLGSGTLQNSDWNDVNLGYGSANLANPSGVGINFDIRKASWPISFLVGISTSKSWANTDTNRAEYSLELLEFDVGVRKYFDVSKHFKPYLSTGLASIDATENRRCFYVSCSESVSKSSIGAFFGTGLMFRLGTSFNLGLNMKYLAGTSTGNTDVDYIQGGLILGFGF